MSEPYCSSPGHPSCDSPQDARKAVISAVAMGQRGISTNGYLQPSLRAP